MGKSIHWELCKKLKFEHAKKMVYAQPSICPRKGPSQIPIVFWFTNGSSNLGQTIRPYNNQQNKKNRQNRAVPADHRVKLKQNEMKDKYIDLARELKKLWNIKVTFILIIIGALGTVTKGLKGLEDLKIRGRVETIETITLLRLARILKKVLETWGYLLRLKLQWKTISKWWWEKLEKE